MRIEDQAVITNEGQIFSGHEHQQLARLIMKRFGNDLAAAASAWRRLLNNDCPDSLFRELLSA